MSTPAISQNESSSALTNFNEDKHGCSPGVDLLKVHQHGFNLAQDSNTTPVPFVLGFAWA